MPSFTTPSVDLAECYNHSNLSPQITYSVTDISFNSQEYFYRTLPSDAATNDARSKLLDMFQWYRVGVLTSSDTYYAKVRVKHDWYPCNHADKVHRYWSHKHPQARTYMDVTPTFTSGHWNWSSILTYQYVNSFCVQLCTSRSHSSSVPHKPNSIPQVYTILWREKFMIAT